ncbi:HD family phosphohydrolase [Crocosphaera sp. XPORK-15E]|uniref:HD family phosphohydrolase n=1 Tax=Crocosphaera sp. XPORK-15E TaxID=3110247 RepID=UPI002B2160CA|nr:HD family phosphohydrolase [Crocosphaera sp. XPORK-15E]MEA5536036.1 HD family phosphohydrolase [Crocosphaera sp. XPORK-15E]
MKTLQFLTQHLEKLRQQYQNSRGLSSKEGKTTAPKKSSTAPQSSNWLAKLHKSQSIRNIHPPVMWGLAVVSLTSVIGYRFYNQPQLSVGTVSPIRIIAPNNGTFEDVQTTEEKRKEVRTGIVPVLQRDIQLTTQLKLDLTETIEEIEQLRQQTAPFPFIDPKIIPLSTQQYLRTATEKDWQTIVTGLTTGGKAASLSQKNQELQPSLKTAIAQLDKYGQTTSTATLKGLLETIKQSRQRYVKATSKTAGLKLSPLSPELIGLSLNLDDQTWNKTQKTLITTLQKILTQGIPPGMPDYLLTDIIAIQLDSSLSPSALQMATGLLMKIVQNQHNLTVDKEETKRRAEQAAQAVEPVIVEVKAGDVIVEAGETITQEEFVLLDSFQLSRRGINWLGLGVSAILVGGTVTGFCVISNRLHRPMRRRDHLLLCLLSLSTPLLGIFNLGYTNLPAVGLLTSSFYGPTLAVTQVIFLSGLSTFAAATINWSYVLAGTAGGLLAAFMAGRLRSRDELARLGGAIGLLQGSLYFLGYLIAAPVAGTIWSAILPGAILYGLSGMAWSVMALGISPYLERIFDLVTPIRLVELANPNCTLLKRLAMETPGTFQHTLFVACLAEAAARELHCNVELVRAGTLYHDIGKMHDPLGFIENQMGAPNKHDEMNDPWASIEIIKKHVSEGLVMANKYGLPRVIRDFIPEHQGTLLISYFYYQAKQEAERNGTGPISEADFRYVGPVPQSRETGILMLADGCEAALRSLKEATPETALAMIHKIFKARWRDDQLTDCGIKYEELPIIAEVFVKVWQQFHHQRIVYPKGALEHQSTSKSN